MEYPRIRYKKTTITENDIISAFNCSINFQSNNEIIGVLIYRTDGDFSFIDYTSKLKTEILFKNVKEAKYHIKCVKEDYCMSEDWYLHHEVPQVRKVD